MVYPRVAFVDAPSPTANVRLDLNSDFGSASCRVEHDGFSLGIPSLEGDADALGVTYGLRQPAVPLRIAGPKAAAIAMLSAVSRELMRPANWLLFQFDELTPPVWLATYRGDPQQLSLDYVTRERGIDYWRTALTLTADAFALGERITLPTQTVTQSPSGDHPMGFALSDIRGDAPAPLRLTLAPTGIAASGQVWLISSTAGPEVVDPVVDIGTGDGFTAGAGTAGGTSVSGAFNGSARVVTVDAGANLVQRLSGTLPVALSSGRYKVLLRCETATTTGVKPYLFGLSVYRTFDVPTFRAVVQQVVNQPNESGAHFFRGWVDLGDFTFPPDCVTPTGVTDPNFGDVAAADFALEIGTADQSAGSVTIDALRFIPLDSDVAEPKLLKARFGSAPLFQGIIGTFDGDVDAYWALNASTGKRYGSMPAPMGGFPAVTPGEENVVLAMALDAGNAYSGIGTTTTSTGTTTTVTPSYHPRYLHLPGDPDA